MTEHVGMIVPHDMMLDRELWRWTPAGTCLHITRTLPCSAVSVGVEMAAQLTVGLEDSVRSLPLVSAVGYACGSASFIDGIAGAEWLSKRMIAAGALTAVTTSEAMLRCLPGRVAVVTPYLPELDERLVAFLEESGREVTSIVGMGLVGRIWETPYRVTADLVRQTDSDAEAVFVACTNLPTYGILADLSRELGKPVVSANQVTVRAVLRDARRVSLPAAS